MNADASATRMTMVGIAARLVLAVAAAALALTACAGSGSTTHDQRAFGFAGTHLVIEDSSSDLQVVPRVGSGIGVQRWLSGTAAKPDHSSWTLSGGTLRLSIDCSGLVFSCGSRFEVAVPPGVTVVVDSGSGTDTVSSLSAPVTINGNQGNVHVNGVSGPLRVSTGSGSITATAIRSFAVRMTADQGSADVSFAAAPRSVTVRCSVGNATVKVPTTGHRYHILVSSGTGSAASKVPDDPRSGSVVQVSSGNGDATVLPASQGVAR
jgi:peptidoglycan hydrolase-like protein with peptidoglycan-binding domain